MQPSGHPAAPIGYGPSGLWVIEHKRAFVVEAVGTGSPAAQAGVRVGDQIVGDSLSVTVALRLVRDGVERTASLELRGFL